MKYLKKQSKEEWISQGAINDGGRYTEDWIGTVAIEGSFQKGAPGKHSAIGGPRRRTKVWRARHSTSSMGIDESHTSLRAMEGLAKKTCLAAIYSHGQPCSRSTWALTAATLCAVHEFTGTQTAWRNADRLEECRSGHEKAADASLGLLLCGSDSFL